MQDRREGIRCLHGAEGKRSSTLRTQGINTCPAKSRPFDLRRCIVLGRQPSINTSGIISLDTCASRRTWTSCINGQRPIYPNTGQRRRKRRGRTLQ